MRARGVRGKASEAPEGAVIQPTRRDTITYKQGSKKQEQGDRRRQLIVQMSGVFLEWARLFREANGSAKSGSPEAQTLITTGRSCSTSVPYAVRPEMEKMVKHRAFIEEFFGEFDSKSTCDRAGKKVSWESTPKI